MSEAPLYPVGKNILVELTGKYKHIVAAAKVYESQTHGVVVAIGKDIHNCDFKVGDTVYWQEYREGSTVQFGEHKYSFVAIADIQGASSA